MHPFLGAFAPSFSAVGSTATATLPTVTVTSSATAYNNITPVQILASTAADVSWIHIRNPANFFAATRTSTVIEVMAGGAGSEYTIIGPVSIGYSGGAGWTSLPIYVPAGTRLSMRMRSARTSTGLNFSFAIGYGGATRDGVGLPQRWVAYGLSDDASANAQGTIVTPGNGAFGSWTAITTSTTYAHDLWVPVIDGGTQTTMTAINTRVQFCPETTANSATAATNETIWEAGTVVTNTSEQMGDANIGGATVGQNRGGFLPLGGIVYAPRPAGSAISARARASAAPNANALGCSILAAL